MLLFEQEKDEKQKALANFIRNTDSNAPSSASSNESSSRVESLQHAVVNTLSFECERAQHEFDLGKIKSGNPHLEIDLTMLRLGPRLFMADARFVGATQPTRALGDRGVEPRFGVIRKPTILWVPLLLDPDGENKNLKLRYVLLCSDGMLSEGAFVDMYNIGHCAGDPIGWFRRSFYQPENMLSERLAFAGRLRLAPAHKKKEDNNPALNRQWKGCGPSWAKVIEFLCTVHWAEVQREEYMQTFCLRHGDAYVTMEMPLDLPPSSSSPTAANVNPKRQMQVLASHLKWLTAMRDEFCPDYPTQVRHVVASEQSVQFAVGQGISVQFETASAD